MDPTLNRVHVEFSREMARSTTSATILLMSQMGGALQSGAVTWSATATAASVELMLIGDATVRIDLSSLESQDGVPLDRATYLGDGQLDFRTGP